MPTSIEAGQSEDRAGAEFRAYLPEYFDDMDFSQLVEIALEGDGNPHHAVLSSGAAEFLVDKRRQLLAEIAIRKGRG